jgi:NifU-like protein involved in Fe-S cluster formation
MELGLKFEDGRVRATHHWTNGCSFSKNCISAVARLAVGKTMAELREINMMSIMECTGELPDTHLHCAQLAETTLQKSLDNFLAKSRMD